MSHMEGGKSCLTWEGVSHVSQGVSYVLFT